MDRIQKFLRLLPKKEREMFDLLLSQILTNYKKLPNVQALKGKNNWYRVRVGRYRIIFEVVSNQKVVIRRIGKRDDQTYKGL